MLLTIHDSSLRKVAFIDNNKQGTLNYFNDTWTRYLETGSSIFDFTVFKKAIISDIGQKRAYNALNEKAFVSFHYKGKTYLHTIRKVEENEKVIKCYGINLNLELINEYSIPYKSPKAMSFKEFCEEMDLLNYTFLKIGINEVSDKKISAEWEGTDTKLNRLLSLAKKFGAEIEFDTRLNADSSIKSFTVNVYHEHDDNHQGVGQLSPTVLVYGKNLKTLTRTIDKTRIYNTVVPTGKDDQGNIVDIRGLGAWSVNNAKGEREFYQSGAALYAPLSMQMYPSTFTHATGELDQWTRKDMTVESSSPEVIRSMAYRELKKNCYPAVTYEAEGFADLDIGDTVKVYDDGFSPTLLLEMRVSEQTISFTNPKNNKTTFSNAKALENRLSQGIQQQLDRMIEDAKPYTIKLATDNGIAFKNSQGQTIVTPTLMKGNKVINSGWRWVVDGVIKATSPSYIVRAADINQKVVLTVSAWVDNEEVASEQLTLINTSDGKNGQKGDKGDQGIPGPKGDPGRDGIAGKNGVGLKSTVIAYASSASGYTAPSSGWTNSVPIIPAGQYLWTRTIWTYTDNTNETGYSVARIGRDGNTGKDGIAGKDGVGIKTTSVSYAKSLSGTEKPSTGWTTQIPNVPAGQYLWTRTIWTYTDNTNETGYSVAKMGETGAKGDTGPKGDKGERGERGPQGDRGLQGLQGLQGPKGDQGIPGAKGADGRTHYTHMAYADTVTGSGFSQTNADKAYVGVYIDFNATDSKNPADYRWTKWRGPDGKNGKDGPQGIPGKPGADGRTPYVHRAWANSADGRDGFSTSDSTNKRYLGMLTDFNEADSQDPARYKWTALFGTTEQGGNILLNSGIGWKNKHQQDFVLAEPIKVGKQYTLSVKWWRRDNSTLNFGFRENPSDSMQWINLAYSAELDCWSVTLTSKKNLNAGDTVSFFTVESEGIGNAEWAVLTVGAIPMTSWQPHWSETKKDIDSKADQGLTQEQINALNEKAGIIQAEVEAKASADDLDNWIKAYKDFVKSNETARAQAEKDLISASQRVSNIAKDLGELSDRWNFIDTYMSSSNEGLVIGKNDGSSSMLFSPNGRISMYSAGAEVMYISQGVIHIENGIFSKTIQIGRFREEQYHLNPDMNVIRYVG